MSYNDIKKIDKYIDIALLVVTTYLCIDIYLLIRNIQIQEEYILTSAIIVFIALFWMLVVISSFLFKNKKNSLRNFFLLILGIIPILIDLLVKSNLRGLPLLYLLALFYWCKQIKFPLGSIYLIIPSIVVITFSLINTSTQLYNYNLLNYDNLNIYVFGIIMILVFSYIRNILHTKVEEFESQRIAITEITNTNIKLQDYANKIKEISESEERSRLRRDIHDILAHSLTSMAVQLGACEKLVYKDPKRVEEELILVRETIRESLLEIRMTLRELRLPMENLTNGRISWQKLVDTFSKVTGIAINFDISDDFEIHNDDLNEVIYRVLQEGLTNSYKHGHAKKVDILIRWDIDYLHIRISDNGIGTDTMKEGIGFLGMRERLAKVGGTLAWKSYEGKGFDLGVDIPVDGGGYNNGQ